MQNTNLPTTSCGCCADLLTHRFGRRTLITSAGALALAATLPRMTWAAEGYYEAMVLSCIDPRFPGPTIAYMRGRDMVGKYSHFKIGGAAIGVVAPAFKDWGPTFWANMEASIQLHNISAVIALDHRDCGAAKIAYGADAVRTPEAETATHRAALAEFRKLVGQRHPDLKVETGLMALDGKVEMFTA